MMLIPLTLLHEAGGAGGVGPLFRPRCAISGPPERTPAGLEIFLLQKN